MKEATAIGYEWEKVEMKEFLDLCEVVGFWDERCRDILYKWRSHDCQYREKLKHRYHKHHRRIKKGLKSHISFDNLVGLKSLKPFN